MAQQVMRPLRQWPRLHHHYSSRSPLLLHHLQSSTIFVATTNLPFFSFVTAPSSHRSVHFRSHALKPSAPVQYDRYQAYSRSDDSESDSDSKPSRNYKKREARRAVRWGMELAAFTEPQIKRIIRAASLEPEVYEALMLLKRLRPDVREGKRRQYNLIGKLLKTVEPELMDTLIQSTKDGDHSKIQALSASGTQIIEGDDDEKAEESEIEDNDEICHYDIGIATRWFDGLINKDIDIINEVYSIHSIDYDRQELRKILRKVHTIQEKQKNTEENNGKADVALTSAKKSLTRFLHSLAKRLPTE